MSEATRESLERARKWMLKNSVHTTCLELNEECDVLPALAAEFDSVAKAAKEEGMEKLRELGELATKAETHPELHDNEPGGLDPSAAYCRSCWLRSKAKSEFTAMAMSYVREQLAAAAIRAMKGEGE